MAYEIRPWDVLRLATVDEFTLTIKMTDPSAVRVSLWDWRTEGWVEQRGQTNNERLEWQLTMIDKPDRFVGPNNAIRVRISDVTGNEKEIFRVNATYIGRVP